MKFSRPHAGKNRMTGNMATSGITNRPVLKRVVFAFVGLAAMLVAAPELSAQSSIQDPLMPDPAESTRTVAPEAPLREPVKMPKGRAARADEVVDIIQVRGNRRVESETVLRQIKTKTDEPLNLDTVSLDIRAIYELGYFDDIQVDSTVVESGSQTGKHIVSFLVVEKPAIEAIRYSGNSEVSQEDIEAVVDLKRFGILNTAQVAANTEKIRDLYTEKGFFLAEVDYVISSPPDRPDLAVVTFEIREYAKVMVKQINFLGNKSIPDDELRNIMQTREEHWLSFMSSFGNFRERDFETDLQRITAYYYDKGFVQVSVNMPHIRLSRDKRYLYISIQIDEGDRFSTASLDVQGDLLLERDELLAMTVLKPGETFSYGTMRRDMEALRVLYQDAGYAYVNVNPLTRLDAATKTVAVMYDIEQGKKVNIGRIEVVGNTRTRDKVLRREMLIQEGDQYSITKVETSRARMERLGYFEAVTITSQRGDRDDVINLRVELRERSTGTFQVGAGISSQESFIFNAQISENNFLGRGQSLGFNVQASSIRTLFNLQFSEPWFMGSRWQFSADLYNFDFAYQDFSRLSRGGNLTFGYPISQRFNLGIPGDLSLALTYKLETVDVTPGGTGGTVIQQAPDLFAGGITSSVRVGTYYDTRNNRLFPTSGQYHSFRVEAAARNLTLSENEFLKYEAESRFYFPVVWEFVLRLNANFGYIVSMSEDRPVPIFERFFAGGPTTVRGFERFSLGPVRRVPAAGGDPAFSGNEMQIGGNKRLTLTAELEFPIFAAANIKGVFFLDAGNAFGENQSLTVVPDIFREASDDYHNTLRTAGGAGIRWASPMGPLRFEWGIPLQRLPGEKSYVFDFSISNAF